ncbi:MAG: hypothetical protein N2C14_01790 [Planctomycetales bacterium]
MNAPRSTARSRWLLLLGIAGVSASLLADDPPESANSQGIAAIREIGGVVRPDGQGWEVEFHLRAGNVTDDRLARVAALRNIVALNLRDSKITSAGLTHLKELSQLRRLHLERTAVTDDGVSHLAGLGNLEYLNLYGTSVTDASLHYLTGLKNLKRLYAWRTEVTEAGAARLQEQLPGLRVIRGVDLSRMPSYGSAKPEKPKKPKSSLKWVAATSVSEIPRSQNGLNTQVVFENQSGKTVKLVWISYVNKPTFYATLVPGATRQQNSYSRNIWMITDEADAPLGYFVVQEEESLAVIPAIP